MRLSSRVSSHDLDFTSCTHADVTASALAEVQRGILPTGFIFKLHTRYDARHAGVVGTAHSRDAHPPFKGLKAIQIGSLGRGGMARGPVTGDPRANRLQVRNDTLAFDFGTDADA